MSVISGYFASEEQKKGQREARDIQNLEGFDPAMQVEAQKLKDVLSTLKTEGRDVANAAVDRGYAQARSDYNQNIDTALQNVRSGYVDATGAVNAGVDAAKQALQNSYLTGRQDLTGGAENAVQSLLSGYNQGRADLSGLSQDAIQSLLMGYQQAAQSAAGGAQKAENTLGQGLLGYTGADLSGLAAYINSALKAENNINSGTVSAINQLSPYSNAGNKALENYMALVSTGGKGMLEDNPVYQWQAEQLKKQIGQQLAASGIGRSGVAIENYYTPGLMNLAANEATAQLNRLLPIISGGQSAATQGAGVYQNSGNNLANINMQTGAQSANTGQRIGEAGLQVSGSQAQMQNAIGQYLAGLATQTGQNTANIQGNLGTNLANLSSQAGQTVGQVQNQLGANLANASTMYGGQVSDLNTVMSQYLAGLATNQGSQLANLNQQRASTLGQMGVTQGETQANLANMYANAIANAQAQNATNMQNLILGKATGNANSVIKINDISADYLKAIGEFNAKTADQAGKAIGVLK